MKKLNLLTVAVLATTMVGGVVASAAEPGKGPTDLNTTAKVVFEKQQTGGPNTELPEVPGGGGEVEKPNPGGNTPETTAELMVTFAPNFNFGIIKIDTKAKEVEAMNEIKIKEDATKTATHFVQVKDIRGTHGGWALSATASPLKNGDSTLDGGSTISIKGFNIMGEKETTATAPKGTLTEIQFDGSQTEIMSAEAQAGEGIWSGVMGSTVTQDGETNKDVKFNLTKADAVKASQGEYDSTITWNLVGTPDQASAATPKV